MAVRHLYRLSMARSVAIIVLLAAVTVLAVAGCGGGDAATTSSRSPSLEAGKVLYDTSCAVCHGSNLRGTDLGPSFLSSVYRPDHHADASFLLAVIRGVSPHHWGFGPMPPIEGLTQADVSDITAYVRSVQEAEGFDD